jgi:hypothetical protein
MSRTPTKKPTAAPTKMRSWAIYRLKGTPAALIGTSTLPTRRAPSSGPSRNSQSDFERGQVSYARFPGG